MLRITTPEFPDIFSTTKTVMFRYPEQVNLLAVGHMIPLYTDVVIKTNTRSTKERLSEYPPAYMVYSVRMAELNRGLYGPYFKNAVMLDMSLGNKSVNIKVSKNGIHICGAKDDQGIVVARLTSNLIHESNILLQKMSELPMKDFYDWVKSTLKQSSTFERQTFQTACVIVREKKRLRKVVTGSEIVHTKLQLSSSILRAQFSWMPIDIANFWKARINEEACYEDMLKMIAYFESQGPTLRTIIDAEGPLTLSSNEEAFMKNYSFKLGISINREELSKNINDYMKSTRQKGDPLFVSTYNSSYGHSVNVQFYMPVIIENEEGLEEEKFILKHSYVIYSSGQVMMSSKEVKSMELAFRLFVNLMNHVHLIDNLIDPSSS